VRITAFNWRIGVKFSVRAAPIITATRTVTYMEEAVVPMSDGDVRTKLGTLQSLDDAIAFRLDRLNQPCTACSSGQLCVDHACDLSLIECYQARYTATWHEALADLDPNAIEDIMRPGEDMPLTVAMLSAAMLSRLRELAAEGPVVMDLDGQPVVIELEGQMLHEYPLGPVGEGDAGL
jgi:hypothetical protein